MYFIVVISAFVLKCLLGNAANFLFGPSIRIIWLAVHWNEYILIIDQVINKHSLTK